jgi:hypothetical protein
MLQIRPSCEHFNKQLPYNASDAMICTFECTFCKECVDDILLKVCPNCGGGFEKRPIRPEHLLQKYPASTITVHKPVNVALHQQKIKAL